MILRTVYGGEREFRSGEWGTDHLIQRFRSTYSNAGEIVNTDAAVGLPALGHAIRTVSGVIAQLYLGVWEGRKGDKKPRDDAWQAKLLAEPYDGGSDFDWRWDIVAALESCENALLYKARVGNGRVQALIPVDMDYARIYQDEKTREKKFDVRINANETKTYTTREILHIRGQTVKGGVAGVSRIHQHRDPLGAMLARNKFQGRYFRNDARPGIVFKFPQNITPAQGQVWLDDWNARHQGQDNAGKAGAIGGGAELDVLTPLALKDAQFVETQQLSIIEIGQIMDLHPAWLGAMFEGQPLSKELASFVLQVQLGPRMRRIERALKADPDVFGQNVPIYPKFEVDDLMFADVLTRAQVQHLQIQNGSLLPDEARADNGRPPLPDGAGQIPQITPVGGAPNDPTPSEGTPPSVNEEE